MADEVMAAVSLEQQIECVERELRMRGQVYPRWIAQRKLSQGNADIEMARMQAVLATLRGLKEGGAQAAEPSPEEAAVRRSERLRVLEVVGRNMHSGQYLRLEAAVRRVLGA
jgi:hypothetical protein